MSETNESRYDLYRLAKKQGLQAGVDIARGPEDTSIYLTVGSAWAF